MKKIQTDSAPQPLGHYSQAWVHDNLVFISGQLPIDINNREKKIETIEEQTRQALSNIENILKASGSSMDQVLKVTVYISDIELWSRLNKVYAEIFKEHKPARAVVPTREIHHEYKVEIEAIATTDKKIT